MMTRKRKIEKIAELERVLKDTFRTGEWEIYNKAAEEIGKLNRSMRR